MPRTGLILAVALLLLPLAAGRSGPAEVRFDAPAQAGPGVTALDATWVLLLFGPEGSGSFSLDFPNEAQERNVTVVGLALPRVMPKEVPAESVRTLPGFSAEARFPDGMASLYLQGEHLRVEALGARAEFLPRAGQCLHESVPAAEMPSEQARYTQLCPPGAGVVQTIAAEKGAVPVRIEAEGLQVVEYHHAALSCRGEPDCPADGMRREEPVAATPFGPVSSRVLGYTRLESAGAAVSGAAEVDHVLAGGPALNVAVQGWVRLPLAHAEAPDPCAGCEAPHRETLHAEGNLTLGRLRAAPGGGLAASLGGDVRQARIDERSVDPRLLGLGVAGASVAAVSAAWALRALASLFSRIGQSESLDHPRRRLMMEAIRQNPGIHLRALARLAGGSPTLAQYHVAVLVRNGHAVRRRRGREVCLFENHGRYGDEWTALAALRDESLLRLHGLVGANPGISRPGVVRAAQGWGWSRRTTYHRLRRLEGVGLVVADAAGGGLLAFRPAGRPA